MNESNGEFLEAYRDFNIFKYWNPIEYWLEAWGNTEARGVVLNDLNGKELGFVEDAKVAIDKYWA